VQCDTVAQPFTCSTQCQRRRCQAVQATTHTFSCPPLCKARPGTCKPKAGTPTSQQRKIQTPLSCCQTSAECRNQPVHMLHEKRCHQLKATCSCLHQPTSVCLAAKPNTAGPAGCANTIRTTPHQAAQKMHTTCKSSVWLSVMRQLSLQGSCHIQHANRLFASIHAHHMHQTLYQPNTIAGDAIICAPANLTKHRQHNHVTSSSWQLRSAEWRQWVLQQPARYTQQYMRHALQASSATNAHTAKTAHSYYPSARCLWSGIRASYSSPLQQVE
jgi:hypothetical protein